MREEIKNTMEGKMTRGKAEFERKVTGIHINKHKELKIDIFIIGLFKASFKVLIYSAELLVRIMCSKAIVG
jgi:hypothetical protein